MTEKKGNVVLKTFSELVTRIRLAAGMGIQYSGKRDLYEALGYIRNLKFQDYYNQYERQEIAKAIIEKPVNVTWRGPVLVIESNDEKETALEKAWEELEKQFKLKSKFQCVDKLTGLGQYGILFLGFDDVKVYTDLVKPVEAGTRQLKYIKALSEDQVTIQAYVENSADPRYGLPLTYNVKTTNPTGTTNSTIQVHYTRIIHIVDNAVDNEMLGTPRLKPVFNRLMDLEKVVGGSAEMFWRGAKPGYSGEVDPEYDMSAATEEGLKDQIDEYEHDLRRIFIQQGVKLNPLQTQVADPKGHVDIQIQMISAETGIPKRILTGSERGELSSSQDQDEWYSLIQGRREEFVEPSIIRPFIDRMIEYKVLPEAKDGYNIKWQDLFSISEKDKVDIGKVRTEALNAYSSNLSASSIVPPDAFFEFFLGLNPEQIELIGEMANAYNEEESARIEEEQAIIEEQEPVIEKEPKPAPVKVVRKTKPVNE